MTNSTSQAPSITVVPDMNMYLKKDATVLEAAFTLAPQGFDGASAAPVDQNVIFLGDVSGSMVQPAAKLDFMKKAMVEGIQLLPTSAWFAVVTFSDEARPVQELCQATDANKRAAITKVNKIQAEYGTQMSKGLDIALREHSKRPKAAGSCIMLTDGQNNDTDESPLDRALARYIEEAKKGSVLQVHARGVGKDFSFPQVKKIGTATKGEAPEYIAEPAELVANFAQLIEQAKSNTVTDVRLNVWTPKIVQLRACKKTIPSILDLMGTEITDTTSGVLKSFPLGAMSSEQAEYYLEFGLQPKPVRQQASAGWVSVSFMYNGQRIESERFIVKTEWTDENDLRSTRIAKGVARAKGDVDLYENIEEGLKALGKGQTDVATQKLGAAAKIAHSKGDAEMTKKLAAICDIQDAASGTVRLKQGAKDNKDATLRLEAASVRTAKRTK